MGKGMVAYFISVLIYSLQYGYVFFCLKTDNKKTCRYFFPFKYIQYL